VSWILLANGVHAGDGVSAPTSLTLWRCRYRALCYRKRDSAALAITLVQSDTAISFTAAAGASKFSLRPDARGLGQIDCRAWVSPEQRTIPARAVSVNGLYAGGAQLVDEKLMESGRCPYKSFGYRKPGGGGSRSPSARSAIFVQARRRIAALFLVVSFSRFRPDAGAFHGSFADRISKMLPAPPSAVTQQGVDPAASLRASNRRAQPRDTLSAIAGSRKRSWLAESETHP